MNSLTSSRGDDPTHVERARVRSRGPSVAKLAFLTPNVDFDTVSFVC